MKVFTIPNLITTLRIILIPLFVIALTYGEKGTALVLFVCAGVSDALDGLLARLTGQKTALGAFLDPLADKSLLITSFVLFTVFGWVPLWLTIVIISRDIVISLGWLGLSLISGIKRIAPTKIGKSAIASQIILIAYTLLAVNYSLPNLHPGFFFLVASLTVISGLQYILRALEQASEKHNGHPH